MYVNLFIDSAFQSMELCILWTIVFFIIERKSGLCILDAKNMCMPAQFCPTLCNPIDYSPPGSSVHGILQAKIIEGDAIFSSRESSCPRDLTCVSFKKKKKCFPGDTRGKEFACQSILDTVVV